MLLGIASVSQAQFFPKVPDMKGKAIFGGNLGLGLNGNRFNLTLAPQVGYRVFNFVELGARGSYSLNMYFSRQYGTESLHGFGFGPYITFQVYSGLVIHGEYERLYLLQHYNGQNVGNWYNNFFVGGGYRSYTSERSYAFFLLLYNLNWDHQNMHEGGSPYASPLQIRVGYCFGV